jgi:hypothetical protein
MTAPADEIRELCSATIVRLRMITATKGAFADPADVRLQVRLAIHDLEVADDAFARHGLLKP